MLTYYVCSTKIGEISDISKCFENFVSQTLGVLTRIYAAELRNLKKILKEEATWYFLALAGLLILLYMGANVIIDTYFYVISLNILIFLFSYIVLRIKKKCITTLML